MGRSYNDTAASNLPMLAKQNTATLSANDNTKDTIAIPENSRRSSGSGAFSVKRAKMGDPDFDYSALNTNLRYTPIG